MTGVALAHLDELRIAVGEVDALASVALSWFDDGDWNGADPALVERAGHLLGVIARSAATAASKVDRFHVAVADAKPTPTGERWDYNDGTASGG
jgi:hypothetical protein